MSVPARGGSSADIKVSSTAPALSKSLLSTPEFMQLKRQCLNLNPSETLNAFQPTESAR